MELLISNRLLNLRRFRTSVWLFPFAFVFHVLEELHGFTTWVQLFINPQFTQTHYLTVHLSGMGMGFLLAGLISKWPRQWLLFIYLSIFILPAMFFNIFFHLGASIFYNTYSPGLVTALILYPPILFLVIGNALRENLIGPKQLTIAFPIAGLFHACEVAYNVCLFGN